MDRVESKIVFTFRESLEGGYEAQAIGHSIFTQAATMEELEANVKHAVACHFAEIELVPEIHLIKAAPPTRVFGSAKGEFAVPDDFNDPDPEIEDMFYNSRLFPE
jgi:hypothetical protein